MMINRAFWKNNNHSPVATLLQTHTFAQQSEVCSPTNKPKEKAQNQNILTHFSCIGNQHKKGCQRFAFIGWCSSLQHPIHSGKHNSTKLICLRKPFPPDGGQVVVGLKLKCHLEFVFGKELPNATPKTAEAYCWRRKRWPPVIANLPTRTFAFHRFFVRLCSTVVVTTKMAW